MPWIYEDISENFTFYTSNSRGERIPCKGSALQKIRVADSEAASESKEENGTREEET